MSGAAMKWARRQNAGSAPLKAVVNVIAARADNKGATWASQATLAADANMGERTVRRHLAMLEALGVITRTVRSTGSKGRLTDIITLSLHRDFDVSAKDIRAAKMVANPHPQECSNRPLCGVPTGQRWPGNRKGTTYPSQGEELTYQGMALDRSGSLSRHRLRVVGGLAWDSSGYDGGEIPL